eukprot:gene11897-12041_t
MPVEVEPGFSTPQPVRPLQSLSGHEDSFQVDSFNRAVHRGSTAGKLSSLFKGKMSLSRSSVGVPSPGVLSNRSPATPSAGALMSADDLLLWSNEPIHTSLLRMIPEHTNRAVKIFVGILRYCGDAAGSEVLSQAQAIEIAQKLLHQGLKRSELRDELYMQLVKQTRSNPSPSSKARAWQLFHLVAAAMPPSKDFTGMISEYVHGVVQDMDSLELAKPEAVATWAALKRSTRCGPRRTLPSVEEISAHLCGSKLTTIVFFLDETFEEVAYDITTSISEAVAQLAGLINLQNYQTFTLYEAVRAVNTKVLNDPLAEEHMLLDENRYIADIVAELRHPRVIREGCQSRLLFKKRMFRETDENISEPQFINLSYVQAQHDYLAGNYPVVREDAAQIAALQMHAEYGPGLDYDPEAFMAGIERFVTRQVFMTRPREEWKGDVAARYKALINFTKEDARTQFMRILRTLPYGNATFFAVKRIEDPIGLLPPRLILGINKRGVHFFRPVPKEYLHSAELRDIMQFGSSSQAVFFKMRIAGVLHIFQFETRQGEDICMALQTHINDIMMKRYSKVKAAAEPRPGDSMQVTPGSAIASPVQLLSGFVGGNPAYNSRMEEHIKEQQQQLEEAQAAVAAAQAAEGQNRVEKESLLNELNDLRELMSNEAASKSALQDQLDAVERQLGELRNELDMTRSALHAASASASEHSDRAQVEHARLTELEALLEAKHKELEDAQGRAAASSRAAEAAAAEREQLERKVVRLERSKEAEAEELKESYEREAAELRNQLKQRADKLNTMLEAAAHQVAHIEELKTELEAARVDAAEVEELREMKKDIERKEKQQAAIIENQAKRLEELDRLYREEVVARKRAHNALQDMKGKIRVYCRIRPLLEFEVAKQQVSAISAPNAVTVSHNWKDEKKPREYDFDSVFGPGDSQEAVFEDTRHLVRSALDGYNVCVFTYGQTGSGKTFTIYGNEKAPGLTPRGVQELFDLIDKDVGKASYTIRLQMLELYQDTLMDLLLPDQQRRTLRPSTASEPPKLEIKKDPKGTVTVLGATTLPVTSARELLAAVEQGFAKRHTSSTALNHESSRSHLIISCLIEGVNLQSQATTSGKLSFVDLAGSERVKKSGSTGEGLKEAQAINKSLSALGDVISALAAEQPYIPYRNHKLTMLMSDSLGGNAKTLMFVNVSPTDSNLDESQNSLVYATRVRTIKNSALRDEAGKEVLRLRKTVDYWKEQAGLLTTEAKLSADLTDIDDRRCESPNGNDSDSLSVGHIPGSSASSMSGSRPGTASSRLGSASTML